jgi:hypothetical protein
MMNIFMTMTNMMKMTKFKIIGLFIFILTILILWLFYEHYQPLSFTQTLPSGATMATSSEDSSNNIELKDSVATTTYKYGNLIFQIVGTQNNPVDNTQVLTIFQSGKKVLTKDGDTFYRLGDCPTNISSPCDTYSSPTFGVDIIGDGGTDFVLDDASSGADANYDTYYIFELPKDGGTLKELTTIDTTWGATFKDFNNDGSLDIKLDDTTFALWETSMSESVWPQVILSWNPKEQKYTLNQTLMRKPAPTQSDIQSQVDSFKKTNGCTKVQTEYGKGDECSAPWEYALDLIYSGNATSAEQYLNLVWPYVLASCSSEEYCSISASDFKDYLQEQLATSPYYSAILEMNGGKLF